MKEHFSATNNQKNKAAPGKLSATLRQWPKAVSQSLNLLSQYLNQTFAVQTDCVNSRHLFLITQPFSS